MSNILDDIIFSYDFDGCRIIVLLNDQYVGYYVVKDNTLIFYYSLLSKQYDTEAINTFTGQFIESFKIGIVYTEKTSYDLGEFRQRGDTLETETEMMRLWRRRALNLNV